MRSGGLDDVVTFARPGAPVRDGRSRVVGADVPIAVDVPCEIEAGQGSERFANAENAATAPYILRCRREDDLDTLDAGDVAIDQLGHRYDIKSVRPGPKDPRRELEILAVRMAVNA